MYEERAMVAVFRPDAIRAAALVGVVGPRQLDVLKARLLDADIRLAGGN